ncbi:MAG: sigma 54-interacting transcriptional regulator [Pseudomonadota bacterium]|nr:sigma 54-interacting transcriptional regulator [Pseudomonadota bacterium]
MTKRIELQSLVDSHDRPFVVIGKDYTVVAVNSAYEKAFNTSSAALVGQKCHAILHHRDRPCYEVGEDCPYMQCYQTEQTCSCLHTHHDSQGRTRWVRINMYPIKCEDGTTYVGEMLHEIAARDGTEESGELRPVGGSAAFLHAMEQLEQAARTDGPVLLIGETGTGKELAAHFIHRYSSRKDKPYVALDCTVITESLFESEVFGHERGAFTGSVESKKGLFEVASDGTIFLDEIGEASLTTQAKLLRVLETGEFRRVGGNKTIKANARIVCATNRQLWDNVKNGEFREDLYYRIACFCIRVPTLRERLEDIPRIAESLLQRLGQREAASFRLTDDAADLLCTYHYPGNIRELRNILQVAIAHRGHKQDGVIQREAIARALHMRFSLTSSQVGEDQQRASARIGVASPVARGSTEPTGEAAAVRERSSVVTPSLQDVEAEHIAELLSRYGGNRRKVAIALNISERTLYRKLARFNLKAK